MDKPPQYYQPPPAPEETALAAATAMQNQHAGEASARIDTSRLMALYGTRLAIAGTAAGSPLLNTGTFNTGPYGGIKGGG